MRRLFIFSVVGYLACLAASCRERGSARRVADEPGETYAVRKSFGAGPVKFAVELSATSITTADSVRCRMTLDVAEGYEAEFPDVAFPADMPGVIVTDYDEREAKEGNRRISRRDYEFEPEYEGTLTLPKMEVYSHQVGEVKEDVFETEPIEIEVKSTRETAGDLELKPMRGLVTVEEIEAQNRRVWPWIVAGVVATAALLVLVVYLMRRPRPVPPPPPAHETALKRLRELAERGWIAAGTAEPFFVEVTGIVRDYIEQAFGVKAPEQTTEEFLAGMVREPAVSRHRQVLEPFLVAADEVKFACLRPDGPAMQRAFDTAEDFVVQTSRSGDGRA